MGHGARHGRSGAILGGVVGCMPRLSVNHAGGSTHVWVSRASGVARPRVGVARTRGRIVLARVGAPGLSMPTPRGPSTTMRCKVYRYVTKQRALSHVNRPLTCLDSMCCNNSPRGPDAGWRARRHHAQSSLRIVADRRREDGWTHSVRPRRRVACVARGRHGRAASALPTMPT